MCTMYDVNAINFLIFKDGNVDTIRIPKGLRNPRKFLLGRPVPKATVGVAC